MTESQRTSFALLAALGAAAATLLLLALLSGPARTVRADPGTLYVAPPPAGNDGNPCSSIQPCATVQRAVGIAQPGDEILVATGHYTDVQVRGALTQVVYISETVTIRGGYSADFSAWDPQAYATTLDAEGQGRVVYIVGNITPTLEGLRVTNGSIDEHGSGICVASGHPVISGCMVFSNTALYTGGGIGFSGADGGVLVNNAVYSNTANGSKGGGVSVSQSSAVAVLDNAIYGNSAAKTGARGGGIAVFKSDGVTLTGNAIYSNTVGWRGSGIDLEETTGATLERNVVHRNTGPNAVAVQDSQTVTLMNNMVVDNGGGLHITSSDVRMLHTTLARNRGGRALASEGGSALWMTNTIVVSHTRGVMAHGAGTVITAVATLWGEGVWANKEDYYVEALDGGTVITVTDVWGDPAFVDPAAGDYHITRASAAVDAGVYCGVDTDIDGQPRPRNDKYDIGADELGYFVYLPLVLRNY